MQIENSFLKVESLSKSYKADAPPVFEGINFEIERGEFVCIIGHSGCGKTTILNVLAGLEDASSGYAYMLGREIKGPSLDRGVVFQGHALMPWMTVLQNVAFAVKSKYPDWSKAGITEHSKKYLSGNSCSLGNWWFSASATFTSEGNKKYSCWILALHVDGSCGRYRVSWH